MILKKQSPNDFLLKNYFLYDYTIFTEFSTFVDISLLNKNALLPAKNLNTNEFFFSPSFKSCVDNEILNQVDSLIIENFYWNQEIDLNAFIFLKTSSFISFFTNNGVDVPTCFKKSKSLTFKNFELPLIKFFNLIMRKGQRDKTVKVFFKKILTRSNRWENYPKPQIPDNQKINFNFFFFFKNYRNLDKTDFFTNSNFFFNLTHTLFFFEKNYENSIFSFPFFNKNKSMDIRSSLFFKNFFLKPFVEVNPVFSYFIYSVDKNIKKFSRGKSGKYVFIWKYVSYYKRLYLAMRLFSKELKFRGERKFYERFLSSIFSLENNFKDSFIYKSKTFSHNYVFKNFKKTLLVSLKTISK